MPLSERDVAILDIEGSWWQYAGAKEALIRDRLDLSPTRYYQQLNRLLDEPAAIEHAPIVVNRLRRLREQRQRARGAKVVGW